jgi:hypothetical protein
MSSVAQTANDKENMRTVKGKEMYGTVVAGATSTRCAHGVIMDETTSTSPGSSTLALLATGGEIDGPGRNFHRSVDEGHFRVLSPTVRRWRRSWGQYEGIQRHCPSEQVLDIVYCYVACDIRPLSRSLTFTVSPC